MAPTLAALIGEDGILQWWQLGLIVVLIGILGFYFWNKKRQG